jgi:hypothetical protein
MGSFLNTWTFPSRPLTGEGPHVVFGYDFDRSSPPAAFDADPGTDLGLQVELEVPWLATWIDADDPPPLAPLGQASLFAYFRDRVTGRTFALLLLLFDSRYADAPSYPSYVDHDTENPFVSMPLNPSARFAVPYPKSAKFGGRTWSGLRPFGARVTQTHFAAALREINRFCGNHPQLAHCAPLAGGQPAFSPLPADYLLTSFGLLHEVFGVDERNHLSMGLHARRLGAWQFR